MEINDKIKVVFDDGHENASIRIGKVTKLDDQFLVLKHDDGTESGIAISRIIRFDILKSGGGDRHD